MADGSQAQTDEAASEPKAMTLFPAELPNYSDAELRRRDALEQAIRWSSSTTVPLDVVAAAQKFSTFIASGEF